MTDQSIEQQLRRYRPALPGSTFRGRVLDAAGEARGVTITPTDWGLMAAAAVLLLLAQATAPGKRAQTLTTQEAAWQNEVAVVAALIDSDRAQQIAETLVPRPEPVVPLPLAPEW